jgi:putative membrane protein
MMTGVGWAMGLGGWLWMLLALAVGIAIVVAFVWLVTSALPGRQRSTSEDAVQILKARFARGEISAQEYEQARRLLGIS